MADEETKLISMRSFFLCPMHPSKYKQACGAITKTSAGMVSAGVNRKEKLSVGDTIAFPHRR